MSEIFRVSVFDLRDMLDDPETADTARTELLRRRYTITDTTIQRTHSDGGLWVARRRNDRKQT